jgi:hypothetical protein
MPEIDKHASRTWHSRIREILNRDWDPIGGCPADEYDGYMGKIAAMLRDNASTKIWWPTSTGQKLIAWG